MSPLALVLLALGLSAPASAGTCPMALNTGAVGSCKFFGCSSSRGPTHCSMGSCFCDAGFCRYPSSTVHVQTRYCVQRVPDSTCHLSRFCYKAGLSTSFCESGLCMCKWGYRLNSDGQCSSDSASLAASGNSTEDSAEDELFLRTANKATAMNIAMFALWMSAFLIALTATATFVYRKLQVQQEGEAGYQFLACE